MTLKPIKGSWAKQCDRCGEIVLTDFCDCEFRDHINEVTSKAFNEFEKRMFNEFNQEENK